ncbi:S8 family peptidase [Metabacillus dongyingensis]|uniref:S8 family peptidase n=1 Tax=Metabacillus dongyingensis TaxID=2874282 RepID=UPI001CBE5CAA|nr:S8 family serine peptidase [Metabacillus dongyingensis]UAL54773.1 S8 family serine peptidase [Metabacillus dongyingensis]
MNMKTFLAASLSTVLLASPLYDVKASDKTNLEKSLESSVIVNSKSGHDVQTITLITGDVVEIRTIEGGKSVINVEPADRNGAGAQVLNIGEDTYVIPSSAMPYLAADKLDKDLFNVTKLIKNGYDDKKLASLPIIVEYADSKSRSIHQKKPALKGTQIERVLESINGAALSTSKKEADTFWDEIIPQNATVQKAKTDSLQFEHGIEKIWLDGRVEATLENSVPQIGAPTAWESGFTGKGIKVAVLDSGIDRNHPDVAGQLDEAVSFVPGETVDDGNGHGTHVASTVLGTGAASDGKNKGVAPEARLVVGKVLSDQGSGLDSWIIDGMEWASERAKVVNMSLGTSEPSDGTDPMSQAVNRLSKENGTLFVIAAGNSGAEGSIGSPGAADSALTIGAVDKTDNLAYFSSKGPRFGDMGLKPDLSAPGVGIIAARSNFAPGSGFYSSKDGTSMATPHVAGAAAILLQKNPDWNGSQLKETLMSTSKKLNYSAFHAGTGRLDVPAALSEVSATGSLSFGFFKWPHDQVEPVQKTVTYTNDGDQAVTLHLQADFKNTTGQDAPAGMLSVSESQITVPANSKKEVTVTLNADLGELGSRYQGHLTAKDHSGKQIAHTAMGMVKEEEKYSLTFKATDRKGAPALTYVGLVNKDMDVEFVAVNGTTELRLRPGTYSAMSMMEVDTDTDQHGIALVGTPEINLDGPKTVELDARKAKEITTEVPKKTEPSYQRMEYYRSIEDKSINHIYLMPVWIDKMYAVPTKEVATGEFEYLTRWRLTKPVLEINFKGKVLDDIPLAGSTPLDGKYNLSAVYAGKGSSSDYERLKAKGKAVLVDRSSEVSTSEQAIAANAAGAKLLIIANYENKEFSEYAGNSDYTDLPLAVASISKREGDKLITASRSGNLKLQVEGEVNTPYVYDLMDVHEGSIPKDLTYAPSNNELVKIDTRYKSDREAPGGEFRYDLRPHTRGAVGFLYKLALPSVRAEWVSATEDTRWYHQANVIDSPWEIRQPAVTYKKGQRLQENWFSPVSRPRLGEGYWTPFRQGNSFQFNIPAWADSGKGHTGGATYDVSVKNQTLKLFQGDALVKEGKGQALNIFSGVSEDRKQYRLVSDAVRDAERWSTSVSTHTEWTFWSQEQDEMRNSLPFYSLDYNVETDMNGNALAAPSTTLDLSVSKLEGAEGYGNIAGAALEVSFNEGKSWKSVKLEQKANAQWTAKINNPKSGKYVSLRAAAWDDQGNKISQEVIKAYGLR